MLRQPIIRAIVILPLFLTACAVGATPNNPNTDWFKKAGFGVFVHYLWDIQNNPDQLHSLGKQTSWDQCVHEFDVKRFADQMAQIKPGYVIFTMHQRTRYLIAPNSTFDRISGYKSGEACSTRDLVFDLYNELHRHNIPLMLYWTGDGPRQDPKAAKAFGASGTVTDDFVNKWASVVAEYGERYKDKVVGWWCDGCYSFIGYNEAKLGVIAKGLKAGNPKRIVALNSGVNPTVMYYSAHEDYTAGEMNRFLEQPATRWLNRMQWHILSFLGCGQGDIGAAWANPGVGYTKRDLIDYVYDVNQAGGVVSIDAMLYRDGALDRSQFEMLKALRPGLIAHNPVVPIPAGNLAYHKPARLLSLDGSHELVVNSGVHFPKLGVDGNLKTVALAGGEWPWTFEVNLLEPHKIRRVKVTFGSGYATKLDIQISVDGAAWSTVSEADNLNGSPYSCEFAPTKAKYVRVRGLKPDGENQPGAQMSIAELEVYE